jgi:hypothetical protein
MKTNEIPVNLHLVFQEDEQQEQIQRWAWMRSLMVCGLLGFFVPTVDAEDVPLPEEETWHYAVRYKYGPVVMKAGSACYRFRTKVREDRVVAETSLHFRTNAFFDRVFLIRDTLLSRATFPEFRPIYHSRSIHEGNTHLTETMHVKTFGNDRSEWQIRQIRKGEVYIDTVMSANNLGYDMLNIFLYVQQLDYAHMNLNESRQITVFLGNKKTNLIIRYAGQTIVKGSNGQLIKAFLLAADIANDVFSESKSAVEVWISDSERHIPLKIKAKLKIGAAEAELM